MNKRQKLVQQQFLDNEDVVIKRLKQVYTQASKDINQNIADLMARNDADSSSVVYQVEYQKAIQKQINGILDTMNAQQFTTVSDYLQLCYEDGFVGTMFDLQGQGVPFVLPIDQEQIVRAVQLDSKISGGMYASFGEDTKKLKKHITAQVSRGISTGMSYEQVAQQISLKMMGTKYRPGGAYAHALNIARTEGHRIQCQSSFDALYKARNKGADIVKQWDSTLDGVTRPSHREVDGEIKELDEPFSNGLLFPGDPSGAAEEVCNCRCALLQRARCAVKSETSYQKRNNETGELIECSGYKDFKEKYLKSAETLKNSKKSVKIKKGISNEPIKSDDEHYNNCINLFNEADVQYNPVQNHTNIPSEEDIIKVLAGADKTSGSCASVGMAYIGQKHGLDVRDFRGNESMETFRSWENLQELTQIKGMKVLKANGASSLTVGNRLLKQVEVGKEYYLVTGQHAAIVRKTSDSVLQYLELQADSSQEADYGAGWKDFDRNARYTLSWRFGCDSKSNSWHEKLDFMVDVSDSAFDTDEFKSILGYINTNIGEEMKGKGGGIK